MSDILVDSNILLYALDPSDPAKREKATAVIYDTVAAGDAVLSVQVLAEFAVNARSKLDPPLVLDDVLAVLGHLSTACRVLLPSAGTVELALRGMERYIMHFWDAMIWAVAKEHGVTKIITEDCNHGAVLGGVEYHNPFHDL